MVIYKVVIGPGNNSEMIRKIFAQRWWWKIIDMGQVEDANMVWTQLKNNSWLSSMPGNKSDDILNHPARLSYEPCNESLPISNDSLSKIFNKYDLKIYQKYNKKYGKKDEDLNIEDLSYRLNFLIKPQPLTR